MLKTRGPLSAAAYSGQVDAVEALICSGADIEERDGEYEDRPLTLAAFRGHLAVIKKLVSHGVNVEGSTKQGDTALMLAARKGYDEIVTYLIQSCEANIFVKNCYGLSATMQAFGHDNVNTGKLLLLKGGSLTDCDRHNSSALHHSARNASLTAVQYLIEQGLNVRQQNSSGCTPIYSAIKGGCLKTTKYLASENQDLHVRNNMGETPLMYSIKHDKCNILRYLVSLNPPLNIVNRDGDSCLHLAIRKENIEMVEILLKQNIDLRTKNKDDKTVNDIAEEIGNGEIKKLLILKYQEQDEINTFIRLCKYGDLQEVKEGISRGVRVNGESSDGETALIMACHSEHLSVCSYLLEEGANIDLVNADRDTALHAAVRTGNKKLVAQLLKQSPKLFPNRDGLTPLELAKNSTKPIQEMLENYNPDITMNNAGQSKKRSYAEVTEWSEDLNPGSVMEKLDQIHADVLLNPGNAEKLDLPCITPVLQKHQSVLIQNMKVDSDLLQSLHEGGVLSISDMKMVEADSGEGSAKRVLYETDKLKENGVSVLIEALTGPGQMEGNKTLGNMLKSQLKSPKIRKVSTNS